MKNMFKKLFSLIALILWMGLIFYLSNQPGLSSHSPYDWYLRKAAHITEYGILLLLCYNTLWQWIKTKKQKQLLLGAITLALLYAISDEWHQSWVHDRHASPIDVGIDGIGIVGASFVILYWRSRSFLSSRRGKK